MFEVVTGFFRTQLISALPKLAEICKPSAYVTIGIGVVALTFGGGFLTTLAILSTLVLMSSWGAKKYCQAH